MKWIILILLLLLLPVVLAQVTPPPPSDTSTVIIQKIDQEHKNTRKFFSDELTRQREEMIAGLDDRMNYYEVTANNLVQTATWKLGLIWAGITFFIIALNSLLRARAERRKYDLLKKSLVGETTDRVMQQFQQQQKIMEEKFKQSQTQINSNVQEHLNAFQQQIAETQRRNTQQQARSYPQSIPPVMDFDGRPIPTPSDGYIRRQQPQERQQQRQQPQETQSPRISMAELQSLMQQYGLNLNKPTTTQPPADAGVPMPPPYIAPPAPRKLGYFERRRMAKLEKKLLDLQDRKKKRESEEANVMGDIYKLNPTWGNQ